MLLLTYRITHLWEFIVKFFPQVPELLSRQQSSPILDGSGVITASLKVPVPLDDSDTPFIEEDHFETSRLVLKREEGTTLSGKVRHQIGGSIETGIGPSGGDTPSSQEKNGANVAGVIKSKIADFEKLAKKPMYLPKSKSHHTLWTVTSADPWKIQMARNSFQQTSWRRFWREWQATTSLSATNSFLPKSRCISCWSNTFKYNSN